MSTDFKMRQLYGSDYKSKIFKKQEIEAVIIPEKETDLFIKPAKEPTLDAGLNKVIFFNKKIKQGLTARQYAVLEVIKIIQPCTMHWVAKYMKVELNTISGRFGELVKLDKIVVTGKTEDGKSLYKTKIKE